MPRGAARRGMRGLLAPMIDLTPYRFRALIFDCDGTLADTAALHFQSMAGALGAQGHEIDRAWYDARVGLSRGDLFRDYQASFGRRVDVAAASRASQDIFRELAHRAQPIEEILACEPACNFDPHIGVIGVQK